MWLNDCISKCILIYAVTSVPEVKLLFCVWANTVWCIDLMIVWSLSLCLITLCIQLIQFPLSIQECHALPSLETYYLAMIPQWESLYLLKTKIDIRHFNFMVFSHKIPITFTKKMHCPYCCLVSPDTILVKISRQLISIQNKWKPQKPDMWNWKWQSHIDSFWKSDSQEYWTDNDNNIQPEIITQVTEQVCLKPSSINAAFDFY